MNEFLKFSIFALLVVVVFGFITNDSYGNAVFVTLVIAVILYIIAKASIDWKRNPKQIWSRTKGKEAAVKRKESTEEKVPLKLRDILCLGELTENRFIAFSVRFLYYTLLLVILLTLIWTLDVRGEAQGIFVQIPLGIYSIACIIFTVSIMAISKLFKIRTTKLFKKTTNNIIAIAIISPILMLFLL